MAASPYTLADWPIYREKQLGGTEEGEGWEQNRKPQPASNTTEAALSSAIVYSVSSPHQSKSKLESMTSSANLAGGGDGAAGHGGLGMHGGGGRSVDGNGK